MNTPAGLDGQMSEALRNMAAHRAASHAVDRRGWTSQQWADDAKRLMSDLDGSVSSLLNGHVMGLIAERDAAVARAEAAEQALRELVTLKDGPRDADYERRRRSADDLRAEAQNWRDMAADWRLRYEAAVARAEAAEQAEQRVRDLHRPKRDHPLSLVQHEHCSCGAMEKVIAADGYPALGPATYPCATIRALDGTP